MAKTEAKNPPAPSYVTKMRLGVRGTDEWYRAVERLRARVQEARPATPSYGINDLVDDALREMAARVGLEGGWPDRAPRRGPGGFRAERPPEPTARADVRGEEGMLGRQLAEMVLAWEARGRAVPAPVMAKARELVGLA